MPELPEIEHLKRTLEPVLVGAVVRRVRVHRVDVIHAAPGASTKSGIGPRSLLTGGEIASLVRHGKQLAIRAADGRTLCLHMGMTGRLIFRSGRKRSTDDHVHCEWLLDAPSGPGTLAFRDPRRFGGIWVFRRFDDLTANRWSCLGPDALSITRRELARRLAGRNRPIKAALLEQSIIAGVGNIYADESLFRAGILPTRPTPLLTADEITRLARSLKHVLGRAVVAGGSTIRDYVDGNGDPGWFAVQHRVYGRGGCPCLTCGSPLHLAQVAQRSTVYCKACQR